MTTLAALNYHEDLVAREQDVIVLWDLARHCIKTRFVTSKVLLVSAIVTSFLREWAIINPLPNPQLGGPDTYCIRLFLYLEPAQHG